LARIRQGGKRQHLGFFATEAEAKARYDAHCLELGVDPDAGTSSGFRGVTWDKVGSKWRAEIKLDGKNKRLGYFAGTARGEVNAALAFDAAARAAGRPATANFQLQAATAPSKLLEEDVDDAPDVSDFSEDPEDADGSSSVRSLPPESSSRVGELTTAMDGNRRRLPRNLGMKGAINPELPATMAMPIPVPPVCKKRTVAAIGTSAMAEGTLNSAADDSAELLSFKAALAADDIRVQEVNRKNQNGRRKLSAAVRHAAMKTLLLEMQQGIQKALGDDIACSIEMVQIRGHDYIVARGANLLPAAEQNKYLGEVLTQEQLFHMTTLNVCGDADAMQLRYSAEGGLLWGRLCGAEEGSVSGGLAQSAMPDLFKRLHGQWYLLANVSQVSGHASCARPGHTSGSRGC
jgi:hypothetical protein